MSNTSNLENIKNKIEKLHELDSLLGEKEKNKTFMAGDFFTRLVLDIDLVQIGYCTASKGKMATHLHKESDEWFIVVKGKLEVRIEEVSVFITEGQYIKVPVGTRHSVIALTEVEFIFGVMPPEKAYKFI